MDLVDDDDDGTALFKTVEAFSGAFFFDDDDGTALFKTVEAFSGAFFFSTSVELKTKGAGGGAAGREIIDSNMSLPSILTLRHFSAPAVSADELHTEEIFTRRVTVDQAEGLCHRIT